MKKLKYIVECTKLIHIFCTFCTLYGGVNLANFGAFTHILRFLKKADAVEKQNIFRKVTKAIPYFYLIFISKYVIVQYINDITTDERKAKYEILFFYHTVHFRDGSFI